MKSVTTSEPTTETNKIVDGNKSGKGDSVKDISDKLESDAGANNADRTTQSSTEKDDHTQHDGKPNSSKLFNNSGENNNKDKSVNDNGSCKRKLGGQNVQQQPSTRSKTSNSGT